MFVNRKTKDCLIFTKTVDKGNFKYNYKYKYLMFESSRIVVEKYCKWVEGGGGLQPANQNNHTSSCQEQKETRLNINFH
jgi:hypothetical protein